jgi:hypothetical protein
MLVFLDINILSRAKITRNAIAIKPVGESRLGKKLAAPLRLLGSLGLNIDSKLTAPAVANIVLEIDSVTAVPKSSSSFLSTEISF